MLEPRAAIVNMVGRQSALLVTRGVGSAGNRCLPSALTELAKDYLDLVSDHRRDDEDVHQAMDSEKRSYEEMIEQHAKLQDCCPGLFAHRSAEDAIRTIERLEILDGRGLPQRY